MSNGVSDNDPQFNSLGQSNSAPNSSHLIDDVSPYIDPKFLIKIGAKQIISLFIPVSLCMFFVSFIAQNVQFFSSTEVYLIYTPFHTPNADIGTQTWQTLANAGIFLCLVVGMTFLLLLLFKFKCYKCLSGWLVATTFFLVFVISFTFFAEVLRSTMIFFDNVTFAVLLWNFGVLGLISIHWRSPLILQQAYLIFNSMQMSLIFLKYLPKWTCWVLLGALAIWDLVAVLCPRGPLRMLVEMAQKRNRPLFPALIYSTTATLVATVRRDPQSNGRPSEAICLSHIGKQTPELQPSPSAQLLDADAETHPSSQSNGKISASNAVKRLQVNRERHPSSGGNPRPPPFTSSGAESAPHEMQGDRNADQSEQPTSILRDLQDDIVEREDHGVKLGLGDFIFYSLLIGRASLDGDVLTAVACYVAILVGMCLTIVALGVTRKALPALPISIACGITFYFSTAAVITPFMHAISEKRLFF